MAPFIFFTAIFVCGLLNSYFNLAARLKSLRLFKPTAPKTAPPAAASTSATSSTDELETIFSTFDGDGDGFITPKELEASLGRLNLPATPDEVKGMMERADANGDGLIDVGEFREMYESLESTDSDQLREAFGVFDGNKDGVITVEELGEVLVSMGLRRRGEAAEDCKDMIRRVDLDGDGMVNFEEFKMMMATKATSSISSHFD